MSDDKMEKPMADQIALAAARHVLRNTIIPPAMSGASEAATNTPMSDHVARFWQLLAENKVRILVDMHRPDSFGGLGHWDSASFPDDVAKALIADRALTAPSAGTGEGWRHDVPDLLRRASEMVNDVANRGNTGPHHLISEMAACLADAAAAPSPSRREPTRETLTETIIGAAANAATDCDEYCSPKMAIAAADAVLALLDRAGNNK